ncbi:hypothetical protein ACFOVU_11440 [Nocardiopsis sediminis]|uniref:DUF3054 domain-containing protein n=1 Tax=Nocardiopsis sediminis TaxID=1778267 RepID=A0ABV8FMI2_9ACTN
MPNEVKTTRVVLFIMAAIYGITVVVNLVPIDPAVHANLVLTCWPGAFCLAFGLRIPTGGRVLMWSILVLLVIRILWSVGVFFGGDLAGITQLILPIIAMVCLLRARSRLYYRTPVH